MSPTPTGDCGIVVLGPANVPLDCGSEPSVHGRCRFKARWAVRVNTEARQAVRRQEDRGDRALAATDMTSRFETVYKPSTPAGHADQTACDISHVPPAMSACRPRSHPDTRAA